MNRARQASGAPATHADDWLITYADMISLLLCFFVIFFVILSAHKNGHEETPTAPVPAQSHNQPLHQSNPAISAFNKPDNSGNSLADEVATRIGKPFGAEPTPATAAEPKGDRISLLEITSSAFFGSGSADLSESGKSILRDIAVELKSNQYDGYQIVVEGHTDDTPIATARFSSNWELSTARAAAVVRYFLDQGLPAQRLRAAGYADTQPKVPNRDADGNAIPENQAQNRRVVIQLEKIESAN
jgi:chemotaxis protein MotB